MRLPLLIAFALCAGAARADSFDGYTNPLLARAAREAAAPLPELPSRQLLARAGVLPGLDPALLVVQTNSGRWAKLLAQPGRHKSPKGNVPYLIIDRFTTYKEGTERQVLHSGRSAVYPGLSLDLDSGEVVPADLGGDLTVTADGERDFVVKPVGNAKLFALERHLPEATPAKPGQFVMGSRFDIKAFNGTFHLYDDGTRSGRLVLAVDGDGALTGALYSDREGAKYEVAGRVGNPSHAFQFVVKYPRAEHVFSGHLFTGNGAALAGSARLENREAGFYAVRVAE